MHLKLGIGPHTSDYNEGVNVEEIHPGWEKHSIIDLLRIGSTW